jgi:hypothetical protein
MLRDAADVTYRPQVDKDAADLKVTAIIVSIRIRRASMLTADACSS